MRQSAAICRMDTDGKAVRRRGMKKVLLCSHGNNVSLFLPSFCLLGSAILHIIRVSASPDNGSFAVSVSKSLHPFTLSALSDRKPGEDVRCITKQAFTL